MSGKAPSLAGRRRTVARAAAGVLLWLLFAGLVLRADKERHEHPAGDRILVERSVRLFAREAGTDSAGVRRLYSLSVFDRDDQICVMLSTYRDRRGGGLYCYSRSDRRLVEERLVGAPFGRRNLIERVLDAMDRE